MTADVNARVTRCNNHHRPQQHPDVVNIAAAGWPTGNVSR